MEEKVQNPKWEATVARRTNASADQIWQFLQDFFGINKWFPSLAISYGIHGRNGEIGSIRYCEGFSIPPQRIFTNSNNNNSEIVVGWSKEKLTEIDNAKKSLSYEIVDSNIGFNSYAATMKIVDNDGSGNSNGNEQGKGCIVEWSFSVDPVVGFVFDDLVKKYELGLEKMVQKMETDLGNI